MERYRVSDNLGRRDFVQDFGNIRSWQAHESRDSCLSPDLALHQSPAVVTLSKIEGLEIANCENSALPFEHDHSYSSPLLRSARSNFRPRRHLHRLVRQHPPSSSLRPLHPSSAPLISPHPRGRLARRFFQRSPHAVRSAAAC